MSSITLTVKEIDILKQYFVDDSDGDGIETEITIECWADGVEGPGHYAYYTDYPDEGTVFLGEYADWMKRGGITKKAFEEAYAIESGMTVKELRRLGLKVEPCECDYEKCQGWQMVFKEKECLDQE
jgi:hypothetical protein